MQKDYELCGPPMNSARVAVALCPRGQVTLSATHVRRLEFLCYDICLMEDSNGEPRFRQVPRAGGAHPRQAGRRQRLGRTSITIHVETEARRRDTGETIKVTEGVFVYVALDENGWPRPVKGVFHDSRTGQERMARHDGRTVFG